MSDEAGLRRRRHHRVRTAIPVRLSTIEADRDPLSGRPFFRSSQETCDNVSRGGAFVRTTELLDPGRRVLVELTLPGGDQLEAIGRVAWTRRVLSPRTEMPDTGIGLEFLGGAAEQFSALEHYLATTDPEGEEEPGN